jgi:hypothetical protein
MGATPCSLPAVALPGIAATGPVEGPNFAEQSRTVAMEPELVLLASTIAKEAEGCHMRDGEQGLIQVAEQMSLAQQVQRGEQSFLHASDLLWPQFADRS